MDKDKVPITISAANNFIASAQNWLQRDGNQKTKLAYAIGRVMPRIQAQLRLYSSMIEDIAADFEVKIQDISLERCATNDKGHVIRDEKGELVFESTKEGQRNKCKRELERERDGQQRELFELESKFEIEPYYATDIPDSLSGYERALFEGFVIKREADDQSVKLAEAAQAAEA